MKKMLTVARREYFFNLRRPSFLFAVFGVPLFTFAVWFLVFAVIIQSEENLEQIGTVGYVDLAGVLDNPIMPEDNPELFRPYPDETSARGALDNQSIGAYFVLDADYMETGATSIYTYGSVPEALQDAINALLIDNLSRELAQNISLERLQDPVDLTIHTQDSGRVLTEDNLLALFFIPMIFAFLFTMAANTTSGYLMGGVVEEKTNRVMEILITSVTPGQMLLGKIIGLGLLGLTQVVVWAGAGALLIRYGQAIPGLTGLTFPTDLLVIFIAYFAMSYFLMASLMAGLGAIAGSEEESRQYGSILSILFVIPFFFIVSILSDPNGNLPVALTLIPFTAPTAALMRLGVADVPMEQIWLSMGILLLTTVIVVWASARVFRYALLLYGKRIGPREIWRVIRRGATTATTTAKSTQEASA